ncbi:EcsC family protein [Bacillaceae bacterium Marseille-Q3522]|nr:EcsC family protein [Bacillaceae bacterium Marseille-Q3522]
MTYTPRELQVFDKLKRWEQSLYTYETNDLQAIYDKYMEEMFNLLAEDTRTKFFTAIDSSLFHLHSLVQGSFVQADAKERILTAARVFHRDIISIKDIRKLSLDQIHFIVEKQTVRHRFYAFVQGGLAGTGDTFLLGSDLAAQLVINLRASQLIAMCYGYEVNNPFEMMASLKVFHGATLPVRMQAHIWEELLADVQNVENVFFYQGNEDLVGTQSLEQPIKQLLKGLVILLVRKKKFKGVPFLSMAIGAGGNYRLTKKVTDFSEKYYQMRYFLSKSEEENQ